MRVNFTLYSKQLLAFAFLLSSFSLLAQPINNDCTGAVGIDSLFGQPIGMTISSGLFDNTQASSTMNDPTTGFDCFAEPIYSSAPQLGNSLWFTFTGDGNTYFIETDDCGSANYISNGDTQIAIYTGSNGQCSSTLTPIICNEDGPNSVNGDFKSGLTLTTVQDSTYYVLIDGFDGGNGPAVGEYCLQVTQQLVTTCADLNVGDVTDADNIVCFNDTTFFALENTVIPNSEGPVTGFRWIITGADVSGSTNPGADPSFVGAFGESADPYTPAFINNGTQIQTNVIVFFTPVAYAAATDTATMLGFQGLDFSSGCIQTGISTPVVLAGDNGAITADPYSAAATSNSPFNGEAGINITGGGSLLYDVLWDGGETSDTITGLAPGDYTVTISDLGDCVDPLEITITVQDSIPLNTFSPEFEAAVKLYPNPAQDWTELSFNFAETTDLTVRLTNITGQLMKTELINGVANGRFRIDLNNIPAGVYLLQISDENNLLTKKLFID